jgi:hypothetical protein
MPDWIDTPAEAMTVLSILGVVIAVLVFIIDARVNRMYREMKPNGGSSLRDAIDRIEQKIDNHIHWHLEDK